MKTVTVTYGSVEFEREMDSNQIGQLMILLSEMDEPSTDRRKPQYSVQPSLVL